MIRLFDINEIQKYHQVAIYGAGKFGQLVLKELISEGVTPVFFVDQRAENEDSMTVRGIPVISIEDLAKSENTAVLIAVLRGYTDVAEELTKLSNIVLFEIGTLLDSYAGNKQGYDRTLQEQIALYHWFVERWTEKGSLFIRHCELVLTEYCSLRCRDCANMMQYYEHPEHMVYEDMAESFERFLDSIDGLVELKLLGGEPLLYPRLCDVLEKAACCEKIFGINVITNGTVVPAEKTISAMKNTKVLVSISDYGEQSRRLPELVDLLRRNGIRYDQMKYEEWIDVGNPEYRERTEDELNHVYQSCIMTECNTFYRGALYKCPRSAHGNHLGLYGITEEEWVDFREEDKTANERKEKVRELVCRQNAITACAFCNGSTVDTRRIPVAVQM